MERRALTLGDRVKILLRQAHCPICGDLLGSRTVHWDHEWAIGRGGRDSLDNIRAVHAVPCHSEKTRGRGATTAGSDIGEISKSKRLEAERLHGPRKPKTIMMGSKASGWKRGMDGKARRR